MMRFVTLNFLNVRGRQGCEHPTSSHSIETLNFLNIREEQRP